MWLEPFEVHLNRMCGNNTASQLYRCLSDCYNSGINNDGFRKNYSYFMCSYHTLQTAKHHLLFNWGIDSNTQHMQILNNFIWISIRKGTHCSNPHDRIYHSFNTSLLTPPPQHPLPCLQRKESIKGEKKKGSFPTLSAIKKKFILENTITYSKLFKIHFQGDVSC